MIVQEIAGFSCVGHSGRIISHPAIQNDVGSASEIISKPRLSLRGRISYSWIEDFKNRLARNAVQSRGNSRRLAGWLSVALRSPAPADQRLNGTLFRRHPGPDYGCVRMPRTLR